jgi:hypothetical protein
LGTIAATRQDVHERLVQELNADDVAAIAIAFGDLLNDVGGEGDGVTAGPARRVCSLAGVIEAIL